MNRAGYLSSVCGTTASARALLPLNTENATEFWESALVLWKQKSGQTTIPEITIYQSTWDKEIVDYKFNELLASTQSIEEKARILAVSSEKASDWLYAVPIPSLGLKLDPMSLKIACGLQLGSKLCHPHKCICGVMVESNGRHGLACKKQIGILKSSIFVHQ